MSYSYAYQPKVANPYLKNDIPQMESGASQARLYFGGSQVPYNIPALAPTTAKPPGSKEISHRRFGTLTSGAGGMGQMFYAK